MELREFEARALGAKDRLYRVARSILLRDADCEDAVQEALVKAWLRLPRLREPDYFESWLCRILINECKQLLRRRRRRPEEELPERLPAPPPPDPALWDALAALPVDYRVPLVLHHVEGYRAEEITRLLGLPLGAVKWRIHKGKRRLAELLGEEGAQ